MKMMPGQGLPPIARFDAVKARASSREGWRTRVETQTIQIPRNSPRPTQLRVATPCLIISAVQNHSAAQTHRVSSDRRLPSKPVLMPLSNTAPPAPGGLVHRSTCAVINRGISLNSVCSTECESAAARDRPQHQSSKLSSSSSAPSIHHSEGRSHAMLHNAVPIDCSTEVPEDIYCSMLAAAKDVRRRGQHVLMPGPPSLGCKTMRLVNQDLVSGGIARQASGRLTASK